MTHRHGDHAAAIPKLLQRGITVYSNADVQHVTRACRNSHSARTTHRDAAAFCPFEAEHDVPCYGYQVTSTATGEKLVYITDSAYVRYTFTGLTHIMIEANYAEDIMLGNVRDEKVPLSLAERVAGTHMSIYTLLELLRANDMTKVRQIYLLHLSDMSSDAEWFKKLVQQETGAEVYIA